MRRTVLSLLAVATMGLAPGRAGAVLNEGDVAPDFHKTDLGGAAQTLYQYRGKVVVLFVLAYNCTFCNANGASFESNVWQHYQTMRPGQVQVLGPDLNNGTDAQLTTFKNSTGATYPLLRQGSAGAGNENLFIPYGDFDNFAVINKQGIVRYHAYNRWAHGNRYHLDEIRACVDSLVSATVDVGDGPLGRSLTLSAAPNPFRGVTTLDLSNPTEAALDARVAVYDLAGRRVVSLWSAPVPRGTTRIAWEGKDASGARVPPGIYTVHAQVGGTRLVRRVVLLP